MALRLATGKKEVMWPVTVQIPQDGGGVKVIAFKAKFEILTQTEHDELIEARGDVIKRVLVGWEDVKSEDGSEQAPFNDETKAQLLDSSYVRQGLSKAYYEAFLGRKAERKN